MNEKVTADPAGYPEEEDVEALIFNVVIMVLPFQTTDTSQFIIHLGLEVTRAHTVTSVRWWISL